MLAAASTMQWFNGYLRRLLCLPEQASSFAQDVDFLHYFVIGTTAAVALLIGATAVYFVVRFRQRVPGSRGKTVGSTRVLEVLFVGTPLAFFLLWFGLGFRVYLELDRPPPNTLDVYVLAKQWMWKFSYADGPVAQGTLHVPVGRPVRLLMTSRDVIHSFYVPAFRVKRDVLPGRYSELWFQAVAPGRYELLCAEYCGAGHSYMRGEIVALAPEAFDRWMADFGGFAFDGGESLSRLITRAAAWQPPCVLAVGHGGWINARLWSGGKPTPADWPMPLAYGRATSAPSAG